MYNPFSVYTVIPWAILFNVVEALIIIGLDALIGAPFNDTIKAYLCLVLFIVNLTYLIYTILIHLRLFYVKRRGKTCYPVTFLDLLNILIASSLVWQWLFMALYFLDHTMYTDVLSDANVPHMFFNVYLKFYAYSVLALNGSITTIAPLLIVSELAQALAVLYYQILSIIVLGALLTYLLDLLSN